MWMKCPQGMIYDYESQSCTGTPLAFRYCNRNNDSCNGNIKGHVLDGSGSSPAWETCNKLVHHGYQDWKIPSKEELKSLIKCTDGIIPENDNFCGNNNYTSPTIDTTLFSNFPSTWFWTSSSNKAESKNAWHLDFRVGGIGDYGQSFHYFKRDAAAVVCVRVMKPSNETSN